MTAQQPGISGTVESRLFVGVFPGGIVYADKAMETFGVYDRLAFLPFDSLVLQWSRNPCPHALRETIIADAAILQTRKGQDYPISECGQTVKLGAPQRFPGTKFASHHKQQDLRP